MKEREERRENCACLIRVGHPKQLSEQNLFSLLFSADRKKRHTMKGSHQMLFFALFLVFFESAKALETECDVCHVNYYHKVCASS